MCTSKKLIVHILKRLRKQFPFSLLICCGYWIQSYEGQYFKLISDLKLERILTSYVSFYIFHIKIAAGKLNPFVIVTLPFSSLLSITSTYFMRSVKNLFPIRNC